jgi:hypothetical protein
MDADAIPGSESRSLQSQYWRLGTGVGGTPGSPQPSIRIPDVDVAAAGVPRHPARDGVRGWVRQQAPPPARGAGLTAIIPPIWEGKGRMKGKPSAPEPCRQQTVRGPRPEGIPRQGG